MTYHDALRHHVERRMQVDLELPAAVVADEDGDYVYVAPEGPVVWVRPGMSMSPVPVRISAIAATGVKKTAALLTELNEWNDVVPLARFVWDRGVIRVWTDAVIESIEPGELGHSIKHVAFHAHRIGDIAATVYGGTVPWAVNETEPSEDSA